MIHLAIVTAAMLLPIFASAQTITGGTIAGGTFGTAGGGGGSFTDTTCVDGTSCFCDCISAAGTPGTYANATCETAGYSIWGGSTILGCADFDNTALDDGTGSAWAAVYGDHGTGAGGLCPDGELGDGADEGTDNEDCFNIVQDGNCDTNTTNTTTDCALGNGGLGQKYDATYTHGIQGDISWTPSSTVGVTVVFKYSNNFFHNSNFKNDELCTDNAGCYQGFPAGQDNWYACDSYDFIKSSSGTTSMACTRDDANWTTRLFFNGAPNCTSSFVNNATVTKGRFMCVGTDWGWAPWSSDFPGGSFSWPRGDWACMQTKFSGSGTSSGSVTQTWMRQDGASEEVINISGIDLSYGETSDPIRGYYLNPYYNGGDGTASGYCTSTSSPYGSLGCDRAYRYEENIVITNGDPVPCSVAMAPIIGS